MREAIIPVENRISKELIVEEGGTPLDWGEIFGNDHPVELEIGIGKGLYLMGAAQHLPEHNFVGIEYQRKYLNIGRRRVEKRHIENVRFVCTEAHSFLEQFVTDESLTTIHIYFPDPWPKKRHHKRRLIQPAFIELVHRKLKPGGFLLIATDHADYWSWMCEVLENQTLLDTCNRLPEPPPGYEGLTNYEIKYKREGREIYRTGFRKPNVSG